jgi:hypothetical protein
VKLTALNTNFFVLPVLKGIPADMVDIHDSTPLQTLCVHVHGKLWCFTMSLIKLHTRTPAPLINIYLDLCTTPLLQIKPHHSTTQVNHTSQRHESTTQINHTSQILATQTSHEKCATTNSGPPQAAPTSATPPRTELPFHDARRISSPTATGRSALTVASVLAVVVCTASVPIG